MNDAHLDANEGKLSSPEDEEEALDEWERRELAKEEAGMAWAHEHGEW